jgi:hypothetical protein
MYRLPGLLDCFRYAQLLHPARLGLAFAQFGPQLIDVVARLRLQKAD